MGMEINNMATAIRKAMTAAEIAEDFIRAEISELYLLLKSGRLSDLEKERLKERLDLLIKDTKEKHDCCK